MKCCKTGNPLKAVISAVLGAVLLISCSGDSVKYCRLVYEASSEPSYNMSVRMHFPGKEAEYGTSGSTVRQDCGYVPEGFNASVSAEVIRMTGMLVPDDVKVTVKVLVDGSCAAENSGTNSASVTYSVISNN